jgi:hypothetical protein
MALTGGRRCIYRSRSPPQGTLRIDQPQRRYAEFTKLNNCYPCCNVVSLPQTTMPCSKLIIVCCRADLQAAAALGRPPLLPLIHSLEEVVLPPGLLDEVNFPTLDHLEISGPCSTALKQIIPILRQVLLAQKRSLMSTQDIAILLNTADTIILDNVEICPLAVEERRSYAMLSCRARVITHRTAKMV